MVSELPPLVQKALPFLKSAGIALAIFAVGWVVSKWTGYLVLRGVRRARVEESLARFLGSIAHYAVLAATVIAALGAVGVQTTSLVAVLASAGLAVGLALQGSLSSFASGVMILFFKPFVLDDAVILAGHTGRVKDIGLFATTILTPDNHRIIIPNNSVTGGTIQNLTAEGKRRVVIPVGVAYGSDLQQVESRLRAGLETVEGVLTEPEPSVAFTGLGASSLDFEVRFFVEPGDFGAATHAARHAVYASLTEAGIDIPFSQIVVHQASA